MGWATSAEWPLLDTKKLAGCAGRTLGKRLINRAG